MHTESCPQPKGHWFETDWCHACFQSHFFSSNSSYSCWFWICRTFSKNFTLARSAKSSYTITSGTPVRTREVAGPRPVGLEPVTSRVLSGVLTTLLRPLRFLRIVEYEMRTYLLFRLNSHGLRKFLTSVGLEPVTLWLLS